MNELGFISFIAPWYAQPIADLFTQLFGYHSTQNEIQVNPYEAAYSCSVILLLVAMLEGIAARAAYIAKELESNKFKALNYLESRCNKIFPKNELKEIFVVRDSIAHSHLWETKVSTNPQSWGNILKRELSSSFGDSKHKDVLDKESYRTRELKIELVPAKMTQQEAIKVFDIVIQAIKCVDAHTNQIIGIDSCRISFNNYEMNLTDFYDEIKHIAQLGASTDSQGRSIVDSTK